MRKWVLIATFVLAIAALAWLAAAPASAQGPNLDDQVNRIAKTLYCPVCPNTPLDVCSTDACVQWRALIKQKLQQGQTEQEIRDYFVRQYGDVVLGAPPAQGWTWLAYILPAIGIVLGLVIAWATIRQWLARRSGGLLQNEPAKIPDEYADRIEQDLKKEY